MRLLRRVLAVCATIAMGACSPVDVLNATVDRSGVQVRRGIAFGPLERQRMDVWRPREEARAGLPVVVFFYGGSWQSGARADYAFVAAELAERGFVVVVPDYRLHPQAGFPAFVHDAAAAVALARRMAPGWGGDPRRVVLMGHSAGAHIATLLALDPRYLAEAGDSRDRLAGVVGIAGPYDFLPFTGADIRAVFAGAADLRETQPVNFADGRGPPMLLLHGEADRTVLPRNSASLARVTRAAGGEVVLATYPGVGHVGIVLGFSSLFRDRAPVLADAVAFIAALPAR